MVIAGGALALSAWSGCSGTGRVDVASTSSALVPLPSGAAATPVAQQPHLSPTLHLMVREVDLRIEDEDHARDERAARAAGHPDDAAQAGERDDDSAWITVFRGSESIDLVQGVTTAVPLGAAAAPTGEVTAVRLVLASQATLTVGDLTFPVSCPSCQESGLKIFVDDDAPVVAGGHLLLTLDFDLRASMSFDGQGFRLQPVIRIKPVEEG
jgi:hypothetical protein